MAGRTTRRGFLSTSALGGGLLLHGWWDRPGPARSDEPKPGSTAVFAPGTNSLETSGAPIAVIAPAAPRDGDPRARSGGYITEILHRAGLFFEQLSPDGVPSLMRRTDRPIVILAGQVSLTAAQRQALAEWVGRGGSLVGIGGTSGLGEVFGTGGETPLAEGWIKVTAPEHPLTAGLRSSLHVFGGYVVKPGSATSLAAVECGNRPASGSVILENRFGQGLAVLLAPDLVFSIVHIQQGVPVFQDGRPAADDSAPLDDAILKAEDGSVLHWQRDRRPMPPDNVPIFLDPVSDELRELILRSIFHLARRQGTSLPVLWYWPRGLKAVGHISHDSDGNDPKKAAALLDVMRRCGVKSTWCTMYPGGYPKEFYGALQEQGFEIALHYDAKTGGPETSWSKDNLLLQHRWLMKEAGLPQIVSNKNHYTRWEGRLEFYRWCEEAGIATDQTRGPSKKGTIGFPLGGSQPYYPLDDAAESPRILNVLEVNLLTQDLVITCPQEYGGPLLDSALRHHGVAHFLFHPAHILKPAVAEALCGLVEYGKAQGLGWWTSEQIVMWERLRRGVRASWSPAGAFTLRAARPLQQATLLWLRAGEKPPAIHIDGRPAPSDAWNWLGFVFDAVTVDLAGEVRLSR